MNGIIENQVKQIKNHYEKTKEFNPTNLIIKI